MTYFCSVAEALAEAAESLEKAHIQGIIHRDLKPENLMIEGTGRCWIIDFGLANDPAEKKGVSVTPTASAAKGPATISGVMGTPQYMAPEQFHSKAEARTDVWGFGAILYELLTLRRAFDGKSEAKCRELVESTNPCHPRKLVRNVPSDLAAISLKALEKDPARRYPSVQAFADDLRRWLKNEPTKARPARALRRSWLWGRRNPGWASAIAAFVLLISAVVAFSFQIVWAGAEREIAETKESAARDQARDRERESLMLRIQSGRLTTRTRAGWRANVMVHVRQAVGLRVGSDLRSQYGACLLGMDATLRQQFVDTTAYSLAFDGNGKRLLMGGITVDGKHHPARLWDGTINKPTVSKQTGSGPAAFLADGTPVHVACKDHYTYVVWDLARQRSVRELVISENGDPKVKQREPAPFMALSYDGAFFAATPTLAKDKQIVAVWDVRTGKLLHRFAIKATGLAFSPVVKGKKPLLAAGAADGRVTIWSLPDGERLAEFQTHRLQAYALAFRRDVRRPRKAKSDGAGLHGWQLATGHAGGAVITWDLETLQLRTVCHGSSYDVFAVAFGPDGMTLASLGRGAVKLWDVTTGRLLLNVDAYHYPTALAFSADGKQLATSGLETGRRPRTDVWRLESGRGLYSLYGLEAPISRMIFSPDGQLVAALADNWELAVWERHSGKLLHVFETPVGYFADNAAVAIDGEGTRLAFSTGERAILWDLVTGNELRSWKLPPGLGDLLAFHPSGKLHLFRWETRDMKLPPMNIADRREHPRVCRLRNLLGPKPMKPIKEIKDFRWHVFKTRAAPDGSSFVVEGAAGPGSRGRSIQAFDALTGKARWKIEVNRTRDASSLEIDRRGRILAAALDDAEEYATLIELSSGKVRGTRSPVPSCLGATLEYWCHNKNGAVSLFHENDKIPLLSLGIDTPDTQAGQFDASGRYLLCGDREKTVILCDLNELYEQLAKVKLGW